MVPFFPGFINGKEIIRKGWGQVEKTVDKTVAPLNQCVDDFQEANELRKEYNVHSAMSKTLSKIADQVRKNEETKAGLDKLREQLKNGEFHGGRGAQKLDGTKTVFYMRSDRKARGFFKYSEEEKGAVEIIAESNKKTRRHCHRESTKEL
jgi:hypothetical protein